MISGEKKSALARSVCVQTYAAPRGINRDPAQIHGSHAGDHESARESQGEGRESERRMNFRHEHHNEGPKR